MTSSTRPPAASGADAHTPGRLAAVTGLCSVVATVVLALTGHGEVAVATGVAGGAVAGGIQVTVNINRRPPDQE
ncbi:hypothetical protein ACFTXO_03590 [Streptomyces sp. NPDC057067]|uniref:hypothetical protein n=1 Tax=Streptomyces TaxID=1883 RepID=UPI00100DDB1E|nr:MULTISPECIES: hypothetical protein [Streptomyces]MBL1291582.1 hypothetical protein [Streptomyces silvae]